MLALLPTNLKLYLYLAAAVAVVGFYGYSVTKAYHLGEAQIEVAVQKATIAETERQQKANEAAQAESAAKVAQLEKDKQSLTDEREKLLEQAKNDPNANKPCLSAPSVQRLRGKNSPKAVSKPTPGKAGHWVSWPHGFTKKSP